MEYKNPSIIPGTFADTNGCHDCYQFVAMHCKWRRNLQGYVE